MNCLLGFNLWDTHLPFISCVPLWRTWTNPCTCLVHSPFYQLENNLPNGSQAQSQYFAKTGSWWEVFLVLTGKLTHILRKQTSLLQKAVIELLYLRTICEWFFNQFINQLILEFQLFILQTHLCSAVFTPVLLVLKSSQDTQTTTNVIAVALCKIDLIQFHLCSAKYNNSCLKVLYTAR